MAVTACNALCLSQCDPAMSCRNRFELNLWRLIMDERSTGRSEKVRHGCKRLRPGWREG